MTSYYKQNKPNAPTGGSSLLDNSKSYNSMLNELHDCVLTKQFMDKAIQPYNNKHNAPLPIAPSLSSSNTHSAKTTTTVLPIAPALPITSKPAPNTFFPIAPTLSDTSGLFATQQPHNEKGRAPARAIEDEDDELLIPSHKDTLFWCFYIIKYGLQAYFTLGNRQFIVEKQEKISAIELLREKKELLKQHKIKPFTSIEEDLSHNPTINIKTFFALLIANELGATYLHKDTYVEVNVNTNQKTHIVQYVRPNVYAYLQEPTQHKRITRIANKYMWNCIDKPVLAMTAYKSEELLELFGKLRIESSIPSDKKPTKKEIYDAVIAYFL